MNTDLSLEIISIDSANTETLGNKLGSALKGGEVIQLSSDLGGGKTTLTRGIVAGAGSTDAVGSPTFTISKLYKTANFNIYHFDFYRLTEPGIIEYELAEAAEDTGSVVIVEWGDIVNDILPQERILIEIEHMSEESRKFRFYIPSKYNYLKEALK